MAKVKVKGYVFMEFDYHDGDYIRKEWRPGLWRCDVGETVDRVFIAERTFEVEVPDDFNPIPAQVKALQEQMAEEVRSHVARVAAIKERLANLLSITNEAAAA